MTSPLYDREAEMSKGERQHFQLSGLGKTIKWWFSNQPHTVCYSHKRNALNVSCNCIVLFCKFNLCCLCKNVKLTVLWMIENYGWLGLTVVYYLLVIPSTRFSREQQMFRFTVLTFQENRRKKYIKVTMECEHTIVKQWKIQIWLAISGKYLIALKDFRFQ